MQYKSFILCMMLAAGAIPAAEAANITNNIAGVGPAKSPIKPYFCIQDANGSVTYALAPGASVDGNRYSGNAYYVGGTLRFGGCDVNDTYLGYVGFLVNEQGQNSVSAYTPPAGVHIAYVDASVNGRGVISGKISYTPIDANFNLAPISPRQNPVWDFVGVNLSGLEFGKVIAPSVIPNLSQADAKSKASDLAEVQSFINSGMNTIRVPLSWGFLQMEGPGQGELNTDYFNAYVKPLLESLTSAHIYAMVDLHAYMRYSEFGKAYSGCGEDGACPDGVKILDPKVYIDVWTKLYALIRNDPKIDMNYIMLDLMNEPVEVDGDAVFTIQAEIIKALRTQGFQGYILVEGNSWSGLHSWTTAAWQDKDGKTYTNAELFSRDNFAKAGITDLSKIIINVHQYLDSNYSGTQDTCVTNMKSTGADGYNLDAFAAYLQRNKLKAMITEFGAGKDQASCTQAMMGLLNYMQDHSARHKDDGFLGWTIWSAGHGWGDYKLRITPSSYQMNILQRYL